MFPHIPLQAITLNLADTHSVSLTVEHILNETIYVPGQDGPPPLSPHPHLSPSTLQTPVNGALSDSDSESGGDISSEEDTVDTSGDDHSSRETSIARGTSRVGVEGDWDHSTRMEAFHSASSYPHGNGGVTTNGLRHRNVGRTDMSSSRDELQASGVNTTSGEVDVDHVLTSSSSGVSGQDPSIPSTPDPQTHDIARKRTDNSSTERSPGATRRKSSDKCSSSLPVRTPSPYSFASLQLRKQKLLQSARRYVYLMISAPPIPIPIFEIGRYRYHCVIGTVYTQYMLEKLFFITVSVETYK